MIYEIYKRAAAVLVKRPFRLWGISLLEIYISSLAVMLFGFPTGVGICISMVFSTSMLMVFLHGYRGDDVHVVQLFDPFKSWETIKRVCCGLAWKTLWVALWSMIPFVGIVFGVIRSYEYYLTPYILLMEPDVPITEAINVSKERMKGYKAKVWLAQWVWVVPLWIAVLILGLLAKIPYLGVIFTIITFIAVVLVALAVPLFKGLVNAAFYEEISNPTIPADAPTLGLPISVSVTKKAEEPAAPAVNNDTKFCPNCGAPNKKTSAFCAQCGTRFDME